MNPHHLFLGTHHDNMVDCQEKGRRCRGTRHHRAKLTEAQVLEILEHEGKMRWIDIAAKYGVSTSNLLAWNNLSKRSTLQVGQKLTVKGGSTQTAKADSSERIEHKVSRGDSPWKIARTYSVSKNDLYKWNGWSKDPVLSVGSTVVVYK